MKIYTKTGDTGTTALYGGTRVAKHDIRIEAYGTIDELNSYIGLIRDQKIDNNSTTSLIRIQNELFTLGAMLATPPKSEHLKNGKERLNIPKISTKNVTLLETEIDDMNLELTPMTNFILPGGNQTVSFCHIARCICRRAERLCTALHEAEIINLEILKYLNRLSDYLFILARKLAKDACIKETPWIPEKE